MHCYVFLSDEAHDSFMISLYIGFITCSHCILVYHMFSLYIGLSHGFYIVKHPLIYGLVLIL